MYSQFMMHGEKNIKYFTSSENYVWNSLWQSPRV